ncbi:hemolymph lipopolysaccharide-binding protein [Anabrus simplex]|uniref:hemolymph lipopolysaccharide-binding protein n=1 Tax=Anabrus simplex TaxID=316456 RepID=UPI0035A2E5E5
MLLLLTLSAMILDSTAISRQCEQVPSLKFSVSSWRNESGHRLVAADVQSDESGRNGVSLMVELLSEKCDGTRAVILRTLSSIEWPEEEASTSTAVARTVVPLPGYRNFPGMGYYKLLPNDMTWREAVEACRKEGTRMLLVESREEIETLLEWTGCCPWVGVRREFSSGPWVNVLGQQMNSTDFFGWYPGEPSGPSNCMALNGFPMGTANRECDHSFHVICEQSL